MPSLKIVPHGQPPTYGYPTIILWLDQNQHVMSGSAIQRLGLKEARAYARDMVETHQDITEVVDVDADRVYTREEYLAL